MESSEDTKRSSSAAMTSRLLPRRNSFLPPDILNPFVYQYDPPWYQWVKVGVVTVLLAPIRCVALLLMFLFGCLMSCLLCGVSEATWQKPLGVYLRVMRWILRRTLRVAFFVCGFHWIEVRGRRATLDEAAILVCGPHSTFFDTMIFVVGPTTSGISRAENIRFPGIGRLGYLAQPLLVQREDKNSREKVLASLAGRARDHLLPQLAIFPEGTCTNRSCLIHFKVGAFVAGVPVQPVLMRWPNVFDSVTWTWEGPSAAKVMWMTLSQLHNRIIIEYLPVYYPNDAEKNDAKLYANNVRQVMAKALGVPVTDHSFEDCRLMMLARKHNLPMASGIVEFSKLSHKLQLDYPRTSDILAHFAEMSRGMSGKITIEEFGDYLGLPQSPALQRLFLLYDRDHSGYIDFREYLIGLTLVAVPTKTADTVKLAFELFDTEKKGHLTEEDFCRVLSTSFNTNKSQSQKLFRQVISSSNDGRITYEDFHRFSEMHPEHTKLFTVYRDFQNEFDQLSPAAAAPKQESSTAPPSVWCTPSLTLSAAS